jgi:hypothetical protein
MRGARYTEKDTRGSGLQTMIQEAMKVTETMKCISLWIYKEEFFLLAYKAMRFLEKSIVSQNHVPLIGFKDVTAVIMKNTIFWDIKCCSPLKVNRRFGGKFWLHLYDRRISHERNQGESRWQVICSSLICWFSTEYTVLDPIREYSL